ncbi:MAG: WD40/YVTN/BNR-like repeat-containing protein, partial [Thermoanaerobaculia bacterium]
MIHRTRRFCLAAVAAVALLLPVTAAALDRAFFWQFEELVSRKPFLRWFWFWDQRAYPQDEIPAGALQRGFDQTEAFAATQPAGADTALQWTAIGPSPVLGGQIGRTGGTREMAGRMTDIAIHPADPNRWLVGGAHGGIWETRDAGATWTSLTDDQPSLATGSIAIAASDPQVIYVGTGEAAFSADAYDGDGLLKST